MFHSPAELKNVSPKLAIFYQLVSNRKQVGISKRKSSCDETETIISCIFQLMLFPKNIAVSRVFQSSTELKNVSSKLAIFYQLASSKKQAGISQRKSSLGETEYLNSKYITNKFHIFQS